MSGEIPRAYPLAPVEDDPRFNFGLVLDVVAVLERHGYPPVQAGLDLVALQQSLYAFVYGGGGVR